MLQTAPQAIERHRIAIAGGGIGGLTAALCLARAGFRPIVIERATALSEVGAGIQLSPNASRILIALGLADDLADVVVEPDGLVVRQGVTGRILSRAQLRPVMRDRYKAPFWVVHRADLQRVLVERVRRTPGIELCLGQVVTQVASHGQTVTVSTAVTDNGDDGREISACAVIGADGLNSAVRRMIAPEARVCPSGQIALRAVARATDLPEPLRRHDVGLWLGPGRHLVHYPIRQGTAVNIVGVVPATPEDRRHDDVLDQRAAAQRFQGWCADVAALLAAAPDFTLWPLADLAPTRRWASGRAALLGDAAHATLPYLAQGGAMAIEDAACLADCLAAEADIPAGLSAYAAARMARAHRIQRQSRRNGRIYHMGGYAGAARDASLVLMGGDRLISRYDWVYRHGAARGEDLPAPAETRTAALP